LFGGFQKGLGPLARDALGWCAYTSGWRPPAAWLLGDRAHCRQGLDLARQCLDVLEGVTPLEPRRRALIAIHERVVNASTAEIACESPDEVRAAWAAGATDEELAVLPELAGPEGYLDWTYQGLTVAHERLSAAVTASPLLPQMTAELILQAGLLAAPGALAMAIGSDRYLAVQDRVAATKGFRPVAWREQMRDWLARALGAGEIEACRGWLDMAVRLTAIVQGLPGDPASPSPCYVPVPGFQRDVRAFARPRRAANPLAAALAPARDAESEAAADSVDGTGEGDRSFPAHGGKASEGRSELEQLPGLGSVRAQLAAVIAVTEAERARQAAGVTVRAGWKNLVFAGGAGTGKSRVAGILARIYRDAGVLSAGTITEVSRAGLSGDHLAETIRLCDDAFDQARGGILLISDAHLPSAVPSQDRRVLQTVAEQTAANRGGDLVVILAGPEPQITLFLDDNQVLADRFPTTITFAPKTPADLAAIFTQRAAEAGFTLGHGAATKAARVLSNAGRRSGTARLAIRLLDQATAAQARRVMTSAGQVALTVLTADDIPGTAAAVPGTARHPADPLAELAAMTGLAPVKEQVRRLAAEVRAEQLRRDAGLAVRAPTRHMIFTGPPGTAKTTVARLIAAIYARLGLLSSGHLVEVSRGDLVGEYVGKTAPMVTAAVARALGGVLFIDEAYSLAAGELANDYGGEAIATLVKLMEDHRRDLVVIAAGYEREMDNFLHANSGLASRFPVSVRFPGYTDRELAQIFTTTALAAGFRLAEDVAPRLRTILAATPRGPDFGNARHIRNLLDQAIANQALRITAADADGADVRELQAIDLPPVPDAQAETERTATPGQYL
jgi:Holliday junction resolvasome RuvABC ATP-dependent DNA helicase subunit